MPDPEDVTPQTNTANTTTKTANNTNNGKTDVLSAKDLNDPLQSSQSTTTNVTATNNGSPTGDPVGAGDPVAQRLAVWSPQIAKVTDPVAFMTSASLNTKGKVDNGKGSYDQAIYDPKSAGGFYEQAKSECSRIAAEIRALQGTQGLSGSQIVQLDMLALFLTSYAALYAEIQVAGGSTDPKRQKAITANVRGALVQAQGFYAGIPAEYLGTGAAQIENAMHEIAIFVESWSVVADQAANTNASSQMWALFLQTNERSRQILNEYGMLDDRGGDTTGTAHMAIQDKKGNWAHTPEEGQKVMDEGGGVMAHALRSYGLAAGQNEAMVVQVKEVVARVRAGEFKSEEECVAAFRKHVGGGRASEAFYKQLNEVARGHWKAYLARNEANLQQTSNEAAAQSHVNAQQHLDMTKTAIQDRDMNAQTKEKNAAKPNMTEEDYIKLGKQALDGQRQVVNKNYDPRHNLDGQMGKDKGGLFLPSTDGMTREYDQFGNLTRISGQDSAMVVSNGPTEQQLYELGQATLSEQEHGYIEMDGGKTDRAYENALAAQERAKISAQLAKKELAAGEEHLKASLSHYLKAQTYITEARAHAAYVKGKHPALQTGLTSLETELKAIEAKLEQDAAIREQLKKAQGDLEKILSNYTKDLENYRPEQLKVPMPEATINGHRVESERYQKLTIDLSGPAWGVFWWLGGLEGSYSKVKEEDNNWKKAKIEIYAGLKADLWIVEAGVKVKGFFEAQKKDADGLADTLYAGGEELARWAYAWWYDLAAMSGQIGSAIEGSINSGNSVYNAVMKSAMDGDLVGAEISDAEERMQGIYEKLAGQLGAVFYKSNLDEAEGFKMAGQVLPVEDVARGLRALEGIKGDAAAQIQKEQAAFVKQGRLAKSDALSEVAQVDPGKNSADVKFEAGVGIEGFAGLAFGDENKVTLGVSRVYSIKDGDGEGFDYTTKTETKVKLAGEFKNGSGFEIGVAGKDDGWKGSVEITIPIAKAENTDGSAAMQAMSEDITGVEASDVEEWARKVQAKLDKRDWLKFLKTDMKVDASKLVSAKIETSLKAKVGVEVELNNDLSHKGHTVSFAFVNKIEGGNRMAKIGYEQGNVVSWKNGG